MKNLNNIVVENLSLEFGQELKKVFEELGVDVNAASFTSNKKNHNYFIYYGIIDSVFSLWDYNYVLKANAKIITLEELKAMKTQNEYPKMMYVSDEKDFTAFTVNKREIAFEKEINGNTYYFYQQLNGNYQSWKYAVELDHFEKQVKEITIEDILKECKEAIESKFGKLENLKIKL